MKVADTRPPVYPSLLPLLTVQGEEKEEGKGWGEMVVSQICGMLLARHP